MSVKPLQINQRVYLPYAHLVCENQMIVNEKLIQTIPNLLTSPWACIIEKYYVWIWLKQTQPQRCGSNHCKINQMAC